MGNGGLSLQMLDQALFPLKISSMISCASNINCMYVDALGCKWGGEWGENGEIFQFLGGLFGLYWFLAYFCNANGIEKQVKTF